MSPASVAPEIRRRMGRLHPGIPLQVTELKSQTRERFAGERMMAWLAGVLGPLDNACGAWRVWRESTPNNAAGRHRGIFRYCGCSHTNGVVCTVIPRCDDSHVLRPAERLPAVQAADSTTRSNALSCQHELAAGGWRHGRALFRSVRYRSAGGIQPSCLHDSRPVIPAAVGLVSERQKARAADALGAKPRTPDLLGRRSAGVFHVGRRSLPHRER